MLEHKSCYHINNYARHLRRSLGSVLGLKSRYPMQIPEQFLSFFNKKGKYGDQMLLRRYTNMRINQKFTYSGNIRIAISVIWSLFKKLFIHIFITAQYLEIKHERRISFSSSYPPTLVCPFPLSGNHNSP